MIEYLKIHTPEQLDEVRRLFQEYAVSLPFDLRFQGFEEELKNLPGEYAPPEGRLLLAICEGRTAGCVALRKISAQDCEMKRLYVKPEFRGKKIGKGLALSIIEEARDIGYRRMLLDTVAPLMKGAVTLYRELGFTPTDPYCKNPIEGALFMELLLDQASA